jgi:hypothetical protein
MFLSHEVLSEAKISFRFKLEMNFELNVSRVAKAAAGAEVPTGATKNE